MKSIVTKFVFTSIACCIGMFSSTAFALTKEEAEADEKLGMALFFMFCHGDMSCSLNITEIKEASDETFTLKVVYGDFANPTKVGVALYNAKTEKLEIQKPDSAKDAPM